MFVTFYQNNSGGYFIQNEDVDAYVIIEGDSLEEILYKADDIFRDYREYCKCCGERWDDDWKDESDLKNEPMIYGEPLEDIQDDLWCNYVIVYFKDGKKRFNLETREWED